MAPQARCARQRPERRSPDPEASRITPELTQDLGKEIPRIALPGEGRPKAAQVSIGVVRGPRRSRGRIGAADSLTPRRRFGRIEPGAGGGVFQEVMGGADRLQSRVVPGVIKVQVGMVDTRKLPVGFLDVGRRRGPGQSSVFRRIGGHRSSLCSVWAIHRPLPPAKTPGSCPTPSTPSPDYR